MISRCLLVCTVLGSLSTAGLFAQEPDSAWSPERFQGLAFRSIGPAFMSGRIADIDVHPHDDNTWYVGVGSGGVWKTLNAGVTWTPIFDDQPTYSIGCVTIDPHNPQRVWVGTGENIGGRHVGFGDGVYRSDDGGGTWTNTGLPRSEHISEIVVHPADPDTVWVASQGPLWSAGGERGVYKSTDGGATWRRTLGDDAWVGATDLVIDPRDPDRLYAATWQRHRTVANYMGGGPGSALYRSEDGGEHWTKLTEGLPKGAMGKIGLAISPHRPDVVYAAIELDRRKGGVFRSSNRGASWEKRSDTVSGGTGPHYYQELYACPHTFDRLYLADVRIQVSDDGGKTFRKLGEKNKHSDNHALAFRSDDPDYLLAGCDGGVYESFDLAENWRFMANLPLTQFYKIALDDAEPFYHVVGGTQDNATQRAPIRTDNYAGIRNSDWRLVLDWDGHQPAVEPGNPDIVYGERQEGFLSRIDMRTGEVVSIQPQPEVGEGHERFNWDAPILVSPHSPTRLYVASHRVWRSDNRGDDWRAMSGDLTRDQERFARDIMGGPHGWDGAWDVLAMSTFHTITSLAESPQQEGLLYAGTDDGLIQVSEDGGGAWRKTEIGTLPGMPARAFVNDLRADLFAADTVYLCADNHKEGDYAPYLMMSQDRGRSWRSIRGNLPDGTLVWRIVQDHVQPDLLFVGTERGVYFSTDRGGRWTHLGGGMPTIAVRDLHIHRRDNDLVCATFGRGIYVLDDLTPLRSVSAEQLAANAMLFAPRKAWWYIERSVMGFQPGKGDQGAGYFQADNPPFGAVFTYWLGDDVRTLAEARQQAEKAAREAGKAVSFPGWDAVEAERREQAPKVWLTVRNADGDVVRRVPGPTKAGFHRIAWDLRHPTPNAVTIVPPAPPEWGMPPRGLLTAPGRYTVSMSIERAGEVTQVGAPQPFDVVPLRSGALPGSPSPVAAKFWRSYEQAVRDHTAMTVAVAGMLAQSKRMAAVLEHTQAAAGATLDRDVTALRRQLLDLDTRFNGDRSRQEPGEKHAPTIQSRLFSVELGVAQATYGPTGTHRRQLEIVRQQLDELRPMLDEHAKQVSALVRRLIEAGAPWLEGQPLPGSGR
tara:strand:- start:13558 stop:16848 length:3291 start_codon:yes stop_codon:yes gene_type:complete